MTGQLCLAAIAVVACAPPLAAQEPSRQLLYAILESRPEENALFSPDTVIQACSSVLLGRQHEKQDVISKVLYCRACAYLALGKTTEAFKDLNDLGEIDPQYKEARVAKGILLARLNRFDEAICEARSAIELDEKYTPAYCLIANVFVVKGNSENAGQWIEKALSIDPKCAEPYYLRGILRYERQELSACVDDLDCFLRLQPLPNAQDPDAPYYIRGSALLALDRCDEALANFQMAKKLNANSYSAMWGIYAVYLAEGKWHLALHVAKELVRLAPSITDSHFAHATALAKVGEKQSAFEALDTAQAITPLDAVALAQTGSILSVLGAYNDALRYFEAALKQNPSCLAGIMGKSDLLATCPDGKIRHGHEALMLAEKADAQVGKVAKNLRFQTAMNVAQAHAECGDFEKAVRFAQRAVELSGPHDWQRRELLEKLSYFRKRRSLQKENPTRARIAPDSCEKLW